MRPSLCSPAYSANPVQTMSVLVPPRYRATWVVRAVGHISGKVVDNEGEWPQCLCLAVERLPCRRRRQSHSRVRRTQTAFISQQSSSFHKSSITADRETLRPGNDLRQTTCAGGGDQPSNDDRSLSFSRHTTAIDLLPPPPP